MSDKDSLLQILINEMALELECQAPECAHGVGGARWKTPPLSEAGALQMLGAHRADAHPGEGGGAARDGGGGKILLAKIPRPEISGGSSQEDFKYFKRTWNQYVRASNEVDEVKLRDQLLHCPDVALKKAVDRALLKEIETLAVVRQSNHVNTLALMTAKQERDEPVRQFAAHLHGLAAVCDLTVTCTCLIKVSEVDKWVLMSLISGLNDDDTKQAVLSKVEEMTLDDTIAFVEARETGRNPVNILSGGLTSGQAHRVHEKEVKEDLEKFKSCGRKAMEKVQTLI
jgi:hypothetical protein